MKHGILLLYICVYSKISIKGKRNWMKAVKRHKLPAIRQISTRDIMYSMVTVANNTLICTKYLNVATRANLKCS